MSIEFNIDDGIAVITLNRPAARNAIDRETALAVEAAVKRIDSEKDIRVGVITGAGGNFCAGMDLKAFLRGEVVRLPGTGFAGVTQARCSKPLIAAVEGYALAGGFEIALACDMIVAGEGAQFGLTEAKRGLVANAGGLVRLPRQLPIKIATELVLVGDLHPASRLATHGLVNVLTPDGKALDGAMELARKIAANGPLAVAVSRQVLSESLEWPEAELFERQNAITAAVFESADAREGARAFAEKRAPVWSVREAVRLDTEALARAQTLNAVLNHHARHRPSAIALSFSGHETSYAALASQAAALAALLSAEGIGRGQHVGYLGKNSDRYFVLLYALASLGAVLVPMNWRLAKEEWQYFLSDAGVVRLFADDAFIDRAQELATHQGIDACTPIPELVRVDSPVAAVEPDPDDVVVQIYSSGTTGRPKGVMLTHRNLLALRAPGYAAGLDWFPREDDRSLLALPVAHIAGTAYALFGLYGGGRVVIEREFDAGVVLEQMERQRVTHMLLAPAALQLVIEHPDCARRDLSHFRYLTYGASPISRTLMDRAFQALSCGFVQMYGMTEAAGGVSALTPEDHRSGIEERLRSAGRAMPGAEVVIAGPEGRHADVNEIGEILVRSAAVMAGYWRQPDATAETIDVDGWLRSGDIGRIDAEGYVFVLDRAKDMIISGGENIYPAEVENSLAGHPSIADVAVFGVASDRWGEVPAAAIVLNPGHELSPEALQEWCADKLARFKIPKHYFALEALPRNAGSKVLKRELRDMFAAGSGASMNVGAD